MDGVARASGAGTLTRLLGTIRSYLELSRVSNLPTCWTNVFVGCAIGASVSGWQPIGFPWIIVALVAVAVSLLYVGGMALNDACDAAIEARERPSRPIPSGRISRRAACMYAGWCLGLGLAVLTIAGTPAALLGAALVACIIAYDALHQRLEASVVLMGACRGLVYLVAATSVAWPLDWLVACTLAGSMTWYVIVLSILARHEMNGRGPERARALPFLQLLAVIVPTAVLLGSETSRSPSSGIETHEWWSLTLGLAVVFWIFWSARHLRAAIPAPVRVVLGWLAGICLLDAFFVALLAPRLGPDWATVTGLALACFVLTLLGHRRILGT